MQVDINDLQLNIKTFNIHVWTIDNSVTCSRTRTSSTEVNLCRLVTNTSAHYMYSYKLKVHVNMHALISDKICYVFTIVSLLACDGET